MNLSPQERAICSGVGVNTMYDKGDVIYIVNKQYNLTFKKYEYWLYIQLKEDYIAGAKLSCLRKIKAVTENDSI